MKKWKKPIVILVTVLVISSGFVTGEEFIAKPLTVEAASITTYTVTASTLNVRSGKSTKNKIIGSVKKGTKLSVQKKESNGWYKIKYKNKTGYVSGSYVKKTTSSSSSTSKASTSSKTTYKVTASTLNVRSGKSTKNKVIGSVKKNTKLTVQKKESNGWYKITYKGKTGYVSGSYVKVNKPSSNSTSNKSSGSTSSKSSTSSKTSYIVMASSLNVRNGAGTNYKSIGTVKKGTKITVISKTSSGWYKINFNKKTGYVSNKYVMQKSNQKSSEFTNVKNLDKSIIVDLKYNTKSNFTGKRIYNFNQAILRKSSAEKLAKANAILKKKGYTIKIWDAYRPYAAQETLWKAYPNSKFVAKPDPTNIRGHQLGATIDMTICFLKNGKEVPMQSKFDEFSSKAYRNYKRNSEQEKYYKIMDKAMKEAGFVGYDKEWWEYRDTKQNFSLLEISPSLY